MPPVRPALANLWFAVAAGLIAVLAAGRIWLLPAHLALDPNEGWNAFQTMHALGAAPLYPSPRALTGNNYPPLSFYIVGGLGRLLGDMIVAGRLIALLAVLLVAGGIFAAARRFGASGRAATIGALLFLAYNVTLFRSYFGIDDPQWLAHAVMMAGFLLIIPPRLGTAPAEKRVIAAALLMFLGGMVKQNLLGFPLAVTLWLALHHRRALAIWAGTAVLAGLGAAALCALAYGPDFFHDLLAPRHFSPARMMRSLPIIAAFIPLLLVMAELARWRRNDNRLDLPLLLIAISLPLGVVQRGGQGVDVNAHFETLIALCIAAAAAPGQWTSPPMRPLLWLSLPFLVLVPLASHQQWRELAGRPQATDAWRAMQNRIAATPGRVACENQALCYWAGKSFEIDFFIYGQRLAAGEDASALTDALAHRFAAVQLNAPPGPARPGQTADLIPPIVAARYRTVFTDAVGRTLSEPRP